MRIRRAQTPGPKPGEMTDEQKTNANAKQKSLELLFDYTKFHIGVYLTLTAAYITAATAKINEHRLLELEPAFFWIAVLSFMLAGLAGGVIASSITQSEAGSTQVFLKEKIGPWSWGVGSARKWTWVEHTAFWVGLMAAVLSFRLAPPAELPKPCPVAASAPKTC